MFSRPRMNAYEFRNNNLSITIKVRVLVSGLFIILEGFRLDQFRRHGPGMSVSTCLIRSMLLERSFKKILIFPHILINTATNNQLM